jgi:hypothetical protein
MFSLGPYAMPALRELGNVTYKALDSVSVPFAH